MAAPVQVRSQLPYGPNGGPPHIGETLMELEALDQRLSGPVQRPGQLIGLLKVADSCKNFVEHSKLPGKCMCGRPTNKHTSVVMQPDAKWSLANCSMIPTNTYGRVEFLSSVRKNAAVFLRTTPTTIDPPRSLAEVAETTATIIEGLLRAVNPRYKRPNLLLSVTGAARNFSLPTRLQRMITAGLQRATGSTDAWVITGGTHAGVMKLTGEIMNDMPADSRPPLIGIATWGIVESRDTLCNRRDVQYISTTSSSLDHNHQAFVLVDDGREGEFGGEIEFRAKFEECIARRFSIPAVTLVIQGGPGTINTCYKSVCAKTPLVVIEGTGQAADCLAYAWMMLHSDENRARAYTHATLVAKVREIAPGACVELTRTILDTVSQRDMVVVFSLEDHGRRELDHAILMASLTANSDVKGLSQRLLQAMTWGRLEVARMALAARSEEPRNDQQKEIWAADINKSLMHALKHNSPEFVELYIEFGAKPQDLKPTKRAYPDTFFGAMQELYEDAVTKPGHLHIILERTRDVTVSFVEKKLSDMLGGQFKFRRERDEFPEDTGHNQEDTRFNMACNILMIWAVTLDKFRLAQQFWQMGEQCIPNALIASSLLDCMSDALEQFYHLADERQKMQHNARKFENLAVGVLQMGFHANPGKVSQMLEAPIVQFGGQTALEVAAATRNLEFISNAAAQSVINSHWYGKISPQTRFVMIILTIIMPFNVWWISLADYHKETTKKPDSGEKLFEINDSTRRNQADLDANSFRRKMSEYGKKYTAFFNAPFVRFWIDVLAFTGLLCLHSYVTLKRFDDELSPAEYVLLIWFISLAVEETRQFLNLWWGYFEDSWNRLDVMIICLYLAGFLYRISDVDATHVQVQSKAIFAINSILLFWRLARYYAVSSVLGPKLIMVKRMVWDVLTFSCLILIFLLGYGVAAQAILFPTVPFDKQTILGSLYRPYFQIYGELFLDEMQAYSNCIGPFPFSSCDAKVAWLIPLLVGLYLLVTNILLINLLIAFMNQTYVEVQEQSRNLWNRQNLELFFEYKSRPLLPAPFILLSHLYKIIQFIWRSCKKIVFKRPTELTDEEKELIRDSKIFQAQQTSRYLKHVAEKALRTTDHIINNTHERVGDLMFEVAALNSQQSSLRQTLDRRQIFTTSLLKQALGTTDVRQLPQLDGPQLFTSLQYPFSSPSASRVPLTAQTALWSSREPYNPVDYTSQSVLTSQGADPADPHSIRFNEKRVGADIDRTSCAGRIDIVDGRPRNPHGRTGICGRGQLFRWGPNHAVDIIITRWKIMQNGSVMEREGHRVLEFVCITRVGENMRALPGGFIHKGEDFRAALRRVFREKVIDAATSVSEENMRWLRENGDSVVAQAAEVGTVYMTDWRNTDNAWVESTIFHHHDEEGTLSERLTLQTGEPVSWMVVHDELPLFASHRVVLTSICADLQSSW